MSKTAASSRTRRPRAPTRTRRAATPPPTPAARPAPRGSEAELAAWLFHRELR